MKVRNLELRDYKKFVTKKPISFLNPDGEVNELTLIVGNNGTGKSSILQAIVALIAPFTHDKFSATALDWSGFEYRFIQSGKMPLQLQATIEFSESELEATVEYAKKLNERGRELSIPKKNKEITLKFDYDKQKALATGGKCDAYQLSGYQYAKQLSALEPDSAKLFDKIGSIFWYTEQRTSYSVSDVFDEETNKLDSLRLFLSNMYNFHIAVTEGKRKLREGQFDFYDKLSKVFSTVFPDRKFVGATPRFDLLEKSTAPDFFLNDGKNDYELSEMSAGERAIFPILMDFAKYNINNSIIIIDEVELHLHAPLQQAFIRALPQLGKNNQFILTTHSDNVAAMFNEEENEIIRLK